MELSCEEVLSPSPKSDEFSGPPVKEEEEVKEDEPREPQAPFDPSILHSVNVMDFLLQDEKRSVVVEEFKEKEIPPFRSFVIDWIFKTVFKEDHSECSVFALSIRLFDLWLESLSNRTDVNKNMTEYLTYAVTCFNLAKKMRSTDCYTSEELQKKADIEWGPDIMLRVEFYILNRLDFYTGLVVYTDIIQNVLERVEWRLSLKDTDAETLRHAAYALGFRLLCTPKGYLWLPSVIGAAAIIGAAGVLNLPLLPSYKVECDVAKVLCMTLDQINFVRALRARPEFLSRINDLTGMFNTKGSLPWPEILEN